ncbi:hypothetical protein GCM10018952_63390 [Streptosporangium vulgare]
MVAPSLAPLASTKRIATTANARVHPISGGTSGRAPRPRGTRAPGGSPSRLSLALDGADGADGARGTGGVGVRDTGVVEVVAGRSSERAQEAGKAPVTTALGAHTHL